MAEKRDRGTIIGMTGEIVSAYLSRNAVEIADIPAVIATVAASLQSLQEAAPSERRPIPAVPVRKSVTEDRLICLLCGRPQRTLKRHLATGHAMTPVEYRRTFGLRPDYPMTAPAYARQRSEMAKRIGLGRNPARRPRKGGTKKQAA